MRTKGQVTQVPVRCKVGGKIVTLYRRKNVWLWNLLLALGVAAGVGAIVFGIIWAAHSSGVTHWGWRLSAKSPFVDTVMENPWAAAGLYFGTVALYSLWRSSQVDYLESEIQRDSSKVLWKKFVPSRSTIYSVYNATTKQMEMKTQYHPAEHHVGIAPTGAFPDGIERDSEWLYGRVLEGDIVQISYRSHYERKKTDASSEPRWTENEIEEITPVEERGA